MRKDAGKLQLSAGLGASTTKTELGKEDKPESDASKKDDSSSVGVKTSGGGLFGNVSTSAAANTTSIFGGAASTGTGLFGSGFKFTPASTSTTAGTSVFGSGSLFGN